MKLSKAQQKVIDEIKNDIDFARSASLYYWIKKHFRLETDEAVERERILDVQMRYRSRNRREIRMGQGS